MYLVAGPNYKTTLSLCLLIIVTVPHGPKISIALQVHGVGDLKQNDSLKWPGWVHYWVKADIQGLPMFPYILSPAPV